MIYNRGWQRSARFADQKDWPARHLKKWCAVMLYIIAYTFAILNNIFLPIRNNRLLLIVQFS